MFDFITTLIGSALASVGIVALWLAYDENEVKWLLAACAESVFALYFLVQFIHWAWETPLSSIFFRQQ